MTRELQFGRRAARSGTARSMVIFLHGYGADGTDLLGLADPLADLPGTGCGRSRSPSARAARAPGDPGGGCRLAPVAPLWFAPLVVASMRRRR